MSPSSGTASSTRSPARRQGLRCRRRWPGVKLKNVKTGAVTEHATDGVFVAIGHAPAVELFAGKLKQKPNGYLWTAPDSTATDVPGVFAAGDVTDDIYRQAVTAAGMGCMAALEAEKFLAAQAARRRGRRIRGRAALSDNRHEQAQRGTGRHDRGFSCRHLTGTSCGSSTRLPKRDRSRTPPRCCTCRNPRSAGRSARSSRRSASSSSTATPAA